MIKNDLTSHTIRVRVPGTSANCGPGFDCIGLACTIYNDLQLTLLKEPKLIIETKGEGADNIPSDDRNIVWRSIQTLLERVGADNEYKGAIIRMENHIPLSRGLGSSAAAIVAGIKAANAILGNPLNRNELLKLATEIEGHPDNVAPALFGGVTVSVVNKGQVQTFSFVPKLRLKLVVAVPDFPLATRLARQVLPTEVPMKDAIFNIGRASMLIGALIKGKERFLQNAFDDALHQPYRTGLVPGMEEVFKAAKAAGAIGVALSGAGPCLIAFTIDRDHVEQEVASSMAQAFLNNNIKTKSLILTLDIRGAVVQNN
ncbi:MAG: homoserine kinase [Selenomonadaceae bacterium]|nr:homoserine kinase [Selenomonadaceae bacterium]